MRYCLGLLVLALALYALPAAAQTPHLVPSDLIKVCTFDSPRDRANCQSYYHGVVEVFQVNAIDPAACRKESLSPADITFFIDYSKTHMLPDTSEGAAQILTYLASPPGMAAHLPCANVAGIWTSGQVSALCKLEFHDDSPCKFYMTGMLEAVQIQGAIRNIRFFCPKGNQVRPDEEALGQVSRWLAADPSRANVPAAAGFVDALRQAFPC